MGAAYQFVGIDELTQFGESWYQLLASRLRKHVGMPVPLRIRGATNPGGIGHEWVRRRFVDAKDPLRPFIPARLDDNPSLDGADYRQSLAILDAATRKQLEEGVWNADASGLVYAWNDKRNGIDELPDGLTFHILGMDFGVTNATAFVVIAWRDNDPHRLRLRGFKEAGMIAPDAADVAKRLEAKYQFARIVGDIGGLGKAFIEEMRRRHSLPVDAAQKTNKQGYIKLLNGALEREQIKVLRATCMPLIDELSELPWHATPEGRKEASGFANHCADAFLYGWRAANAFNETPLAKGPWCRESSGLAHECRVAEATRSSR